MHSVLNLFSIFSLMRNFRPDRMLLSLLGWKFARKRTASTHSGSGRRRNSESPEQQYRRLSKLLDPNVVHIEFLLPNSPDYIDTLSDTFMSPLAVTRTSQRQNVLPFKIRNVASIFEHKQEAPSAAQIPAEKPVDSRSHIERLEENVIPLFKQDFSRVHTIDKTKTTPAKHSALELSVKEDVAGADQIHLPGHQHTVIHLDKGEDRVIVHNHHESKTLHIGPIKKQALHIFSEGETELHIDDTSRGVVKIGKAAGNPA